MSNKFTLSKPMAPPWLMYPEISNGSIGWRMGYGENYMYCFLDWLNSLTALEQNKYKKVFPEPKQWKGFYDQDNFEIDSDEYFFGYNDYIMEFWQPNGEPAYSYKNLLKDLKNGKQKQYLFFCGHQPSKNGEITMSCLNQWWMSDFKVDTNLYCCMGQFVMAEKARLFDDKVMEHKIMESKDPKQIKSLSKKIMNFDEDIWNKVKYSIVLNGNYNKFLQNESLREFLLNTKEDVLVEATPYDNVWGVQMWANDEKIKNPLNWQGENLFGFALMEVRSELKSICQSYNKVHWELLNFEFD